MDNKKLVFKNAYKLLDEIDKYATVNTNRLHGAIGASLLNKRVHLYPNSYWKNQEVYNYSLRDNYPKTHFLITVWEFFKKKKKGNYGAWGEHRILYVGRKESNINRTNTPAVLGTYVF